MSEIITVAACMTPHTRPDTCQHPVTRRNQLRRFLLRKGRLYMLHKAREGFMSRIQCGSWAA